MRLHRALSWLRNRTTPPASLPRRAPVAFQLVKVPGHSYYRTLRDKLRWGAAPNFSAPPGFSAGAGPAPGFAEQFGPGRTAARGRRPPWGTRSWVDRFGAIIGALGLCIGAAAALTATMPASR